MAWFWDDNLTAPRAWVKDLLRAMTPLRRWWLTQASIDIVADDELLDLMELSGCIGVFLGIESFDPGSLRDARKRQNRAAEYGRAVGRLHSRGIAVMAGFIAGFCIVVAEAMAAGLPVIATAVGGIREYGRDGQNMLKLDLPDATELVAQIDRLAQHESLRRRLGESARRDMLAEYSADAMRRRSRIMLGSQAAAPSLQI